MLLEHKMPPVIPAQAGIQKTTAGYDETARYSLATNDDRFHPHITAIDSWIPACAGMTKWKHCKAYLTSRSLRQ